jgi:hypothetical protein
MSSSVIEIPESASPAEKAPGRPAMGRPIFASALIGLGFLILAVNLGIIPPDARRLLASLWPAGVIGVGLGWIALGDQLWGAEPASFAVNRAEAQDADLWVSCGPADVQIESAALAGDLITGELPVPRQPSVAVRGQHTSVRLEPLWGLQVLGRSRWSAALATNLPWQLDLRSSTGNLDLNLRELAPTAVRVRSTFGHVTLTLPAAGGTDLDIRLGLGDLTIQVPEGLGVKVSLQAGALADVTYDERRFIRLGDREIGTPLYAVAAQRCTLAVSLVTGHFQLK